ncbi:MAG: C45 family autoproteolytic acyltransferase/hydrolase [Desulfotomaculales bacterium]
MSGRLPEVTIEGPAYERGYQYGRKCRDRIMVSVETYRRMMASYAGLSWDEALRRAHEYELPILRYDREIFEEMSGLAAGSDLPLAAVLALNARSELTLTGNTPWAECTAVAVAPEASGDGNTWLAQNWDWVGRQREALLLLRIKQPGRPSVVMITEAGLVGKIGLNEAGVGVCLNALFVPEVRAGVPVHVVLRGILNATSLSAAVAAVTRVGMAGAANFLIGDDQGEVVDFEALPSVCVPLHPEDGWLVHTNHLLGPHDLPVDRGLRALPDSVVRFGRARRLLTLRRARQGKFDLRDIQALLADHAGYPSSICRHPDPEREEIFRLETVCSLLMNLQERKLFVAFGNPCRTSYAQYEI